jgi:hypothetical protein
MELDIFKANHCQRLGSRVVEFPACRAVTDDAVDCDLIGVANDTYTHSYGTPD